MQSGKNSSKTGMAVALGLPVLLLLSMESAADTRGFAVSYLHTATNRDDQYCTEKHQTSEMRNKGLRKLFTEEERKELISSALDCLTGLTIAATRGTVDGKVASVYHYPDSVPDPDYQSYFGPNAYGFDLDGAGENQESGFRDPETGETGVDNQLFRALGCFSNYNINLPNRPRNEGLYWRLKASGGGIGAWVFTLSADDLNKDGPATLSFYRAIGHLRKNVSGEALADMTYIVDTHPGTFGEFSGTIKDGVFTSNNTDADLHLIGSYKSMPKIEFANARLRLKLNPDRTASGYLGGYTPWKHYWSRTLMSNEANTGNAAAFYYNLKKFADATPDPQSGENTAISATYRLESVPAFLARPDGTLLTDNR